MTIEELVLKLNSFLLEYVEKQIIKLDNYHIYLNRSFSFSKEENPSYKIDVSFLINEEFISVKSIKHENKETAFYSFVLLFESEIKIRQNFISLKKEIEGIKNEEDFLKFKLKEAENEQNYELAQELKNKLENIKNNKI